MRGTLIRRLVFIGMVFFLTSSPSGWCSLSDPIHNIDDLLADLEKQGVGCFWRHHFAGAVCYADNIALIVPSPSALHLMLQACNTFASSHSLIFNATKTQLIKFSSYPSEFNDTEFNFCGVKLNYSYTPWSLSELGFIRQS